NVMALYSEEYAFHLTADDSARLWLDDQLLLDNWAGPAEKMAFVQLSAGCRYNVRIEYRARTGSSSVKWEWSSASQEREVVPQNLLYPEFDYAPTPLIDGTTTGCTVGLPCN